MNKEVDQNQYIYIDWLVENKRRPSGYWKHSEEIKKYPPEYIAKLSEITGIKIDSSESEAFRMSDLLINIMMEYIINYPNKSNTGKQKGYAPFNIKKMLKPILNHIDKNKPHLAYKNFLLTFKVPAVIGVDAKNLKDLEWFYLDNARSIYQNLFCEKPINKYPTAEMEADTFGTNAYYEFDKFAVRIKYELESNSYTQESLHSLKLFIESFIKHVEGNGFSVSQENKNPFMGGGEQGFILCLCAIWNRIVRQRPENSRIKFSYNRSDYGTEKISGEDKKIYDFMYAIYEFFMTNQDTQPTESTRNALKPDRVKKIIQKFNKISDSFF